MNEGKIRDFCDFLQAGWDERIQQLLQVKQGRALAPVTEARFRRKHGLPTNTSDRRRIQQLIRELNRHCPEWRKLAVQFLVAETAPNLAWLQEPISSLLSIRELDDPAPIIDLLQAKLAECERHPWLLRALLATDQPSVLDFWYDLLRFQLDSSAPKPNLPLYLSFLKQVEHERLGYRDFQQAVIKGKVLNPEFPGSRPRRPPYYHPELDYLGITRSDYFVSMYDRVIKELTQGQVPEAAWERIWWVRRFNGSDYFYGSLEALDDNPARLPAWFTAKWSFDFGRDDPKFPRRISGFSPRTLLLVCFLRSDLDEQIGEALGWQDHAEFMRWFRLPSKQAADSDQGKRERIASWLQLHGAVLEEAMDILSRFPVPGAPVGPEVERDEDAETWKRRYDFICQNLAGNYGRMLDNIYYIWAIWGRKLEHLHQAADVGVIPALRALALASGDEEKSVEILLRAKREGNRWVAQAAHDALTSIAIAHRLTSLEELERKADLALAWSDAGLQGKASRVWWDLAGYRLKLFITRGKAEVAVYSAQGPLRSIPKAVRSHPEFAQVKQARRELARQYSTFRERLQEAMISQQPYPAQEFRLLMANPVFRHLACRLVWQLSKGSDSDQTPRFVMGEEASHQLAEFPFIQIAHPCSLLRHGQWEEWQGKMVAERMTQPFKQCFREVYLWDRSEGERTASLRFARHRILVTKAFALLRSRRYYPGSGNAYQDWPSAGIRARLVWAQDAQRIHQHLFGDLQEVPVMTGAVYFCRLAQKDNSWVEGEQVPLPQVDPIVYSETMRDADLVVSRAAAGEMGFSSQQTIEMRASLIRELARVLEWWNVFVAEDSSHALVDGQLATYRVHLGSGSVFTEPEGRHLSLSSVARRDMDYLPSEDSDSKTVEILSTLALLSQDADISDPHFLDQLGDRSRRQT